MMMALGLFVFSLPTLVYQDLSRRTGWRHGQTPRYLARPANQFLGLGDDLVTMSGSLVPEIAGDVGSLMTLRQMGDAGVSYGLVDGLGNLHGAFVIESLDERGRSFFEDGVPRWTDFTLELRRVDDPFAIMSPAPIAPPEEE